MNHAGNVSFCVAQEISCFLFGVSEHVRHPARGRFLSSFRLHAHFKLYKGKVWLNRNWTTFLLLYQLLSKAAVTMETIINSRRVFGVSNLRWRNMPPLRHWPLFFPPPCCQLTHTSSSCVFLQCACCLLPLFFLIIVFPSCLSVSLFLLLVSYCLFVSTVTLTMCVASCVRCWFNVGGP